MQSKRFLPHTEAERWLSNCSRLGIQFENLLPAYHLTDCYADSEYNRKRGGQIKTIISGDTEVIRLTCDLIVHSRGKRTR